MSYLSVVFLFVFLAFYPSVTVAQVSFAARPLDPIAAKTLERAMARSASVRALVATLEASNVIVHIQTSLVMPEGIGGTTQFVASRGGYRYIRITIDADQSQSARTAILGHELRHACEVAESAADDAKEVLSLYERDGHRHGDYFETRAAIETERSVRLELQVRRALQAEPVIKFDH
jgi:hypothetical protein